jgi:hypothetical protein
METVIDKKTQREITYLPDLATVQAAWDKGYPVSINGFNPTSKNKLSLEFNSINTKYFTLCYLLDTLYGHLSKATVKTYAKL